MNKPEILTTEMNQIVAFKLKDDRIGKDTIYAGLENLVFLKEALKDPYVKVQFISKTMIKFMVALDLGHTWETLNKMPILFILDDDKKIRWPTEYDIQLGVIDV